MFWKNLNTNSILDLIYPPLCFHCGKKIESKRIVCDECTPFFELINPELRCPYCFCEWEGKGACKECREKKRWVLPVLSALEKRGPVSSLLKLLKNSHTSYLAKSAASLMAVQFEKRSFPLPDCLYPATSFFSTSPPYLLAKELSSLFKIPLKTSTRGIEDKVILLIDDFLDREGRVAKVAEKLFARFPRKVYVLTLCC